MTIETTHKGENKVAAKEAEEEKRKKYEEARINDASLMDTDSLKI